MTVAALIISIVALLVACVSAIYTRRQANAQQDATSIERDRRRAERLPDFSAEIENVNGDGGFYRLWVTLTTAEAIDGLSVELPERCCFAFVTGIHGVLDKTHAKSYEGPIREGGRACWRVELLPDRKQSERIDVIARSGSDEWHRSVTVDLPRELSAFWA